MNSAATTLRSTRRQRVGRLDVGEVLASDSRYVVRLARSSDEIEAALRLRYDVFSTEMAIDSGHHAGLESDKFDLRSEHLVTVERSTGRTVGTYRINSVSYVDEIWSLYSFEEFAVESLPREVLFNGVEIGRACIAREHRYSKALFLMWKGLARYLVTREKRYFYGCCSIFTREPSDGAAAYHQLLARDAIHKKLTVEPKRSAIDIDIARSLWDGELPHLFEMYLRLGAKVCGPPMYDAEFGSADFFVLFDLEQMNDRYRRMFFG